MKQIRIIILLIIGMILSYPGETQNLLDSLLHVSDIDYLPADSIRSLNIHKIKYIKYLSDREKDRIQVEKDIVFSRIFELDFNDDGKLIREIRKNSGLDSTGRDHFTLDSTGFRPYSFPCENIYKYNTKGQLIFIETTGCGTLTTTLYIYNNEGILEKIHYYHSLTEKQFDRLLKTDHYEYNNDGLLNSVTIKDTLDNIVETMIYVYDNQKKIAGIRSVENGHVNPFIPFIDMGIISSGQLFINEKPVHIFYHEVIHKPVKREMCIQLTDERYWHFQFSE